ncbi:uncharacterized protein EI97DRAFT_250272 [Westerdykella ornata]|uniref:Uncharacterized protein n=1 Tax=Westerdykella ornata TaxID=318751 RepID=A0A6A6JPI1_WESOR|nr:uncharacterized protein EI97DRAFT_250272 [Westerdykella ornata]KAF2278297.1 hypothetical protein EI97DRAFT_250272 [Westerdykella ornata]
MVLSDRAGAYYSVREVIMLRFYTNLKVSLIVSLFCIFLGPDALWNEWQVLKCPKRRRGEFCSVMSTLWLAFMQPPVGDLISTDLETSSEVVCFITRSILPRDASRDPQHANVAT